MSILNRPSDGLLTALLALRRALIAYGPQTDSGLLALAAPASVVPDGKPDMAKKTLHRWKQLGFFIEIDNTVHLSPEVAAVPSDDLDRLRTILLKLVLAPENNPGFESDQGDDTDVSKASDCTRAIAWTLVQDPCAFPARYRGGVETLQDSQGVDPRPFANDTRWAGFVEWATFLGIGWSATGAPFVPDPAFAIRGVLNDVFLGLEEMPQANFLATLASALPIVDGGRYRVAVEAQIARPWHHHLPSQISPSLSAALLTLEASDDIRLETRSDAPQRILLGRRAREVRPVSHILRASPRRD